ncbi:MAG: class I SAM-dependent methyltransferase [Clostridia bacterium]|nr:class I SAM-dependent methyltransferase [Clostridia bacterium]
MIYDLLAPFYDSINSELDYNGWADFIERIIEREYKGKPELILDLGCGTGSMTLQLAARGYDMTGVDYSPEMLDIARSRAEKMGKDILWLCQDMRSFELYGTVDVAVCCLDSLNHLTTPGDLDKCLSLVHNYLAPNGLFIFDVNGKYKFENIYADRAYTMEEDGAVCIWQNSYNPRTRLCDFYITLFSERADGAYDRYDEIQTERMYTLRQIKQHLSSASLDFLGAYADFNLTPASDDCERIYVVARCNKTNWNY